MRNCKYIRNEIFIEKTSAIKIVLIITLVYSMLKKISNDMNFDMCLIVYTYVIISSILVLVLLKQIETVYKKEIIRCIKICFSSLVMLCIIGISLSRVPMLSLINITNYIVMAMMFAMQAVIGCCINEYCFRAGRINKIFFAGITMMFLLIAGVYFKDDYKIIKILVCLINVISFFIVLYYLKFRSIKKKNKINALKCFFILCEIMFVITAIDVWIDIAAILDMMFWIHFMSFEILAHVIALNLIKEPYKQRIRAMEIDNERLEDINSEIIIKNKNLEASITNLSNREDIYLTFFKYMPHPVIVINDENNRILFVNRKFLELINVTASKNIINKKIDTFIEFLDDRQNKIYDAIFKFDNITKFMSIKYFKYDESRKIMLIKDNTSKVEMEKIKKEIENKRNQENIRTQFLSSISHDLKTPINVIYSVSQLQQIYIEKGDFNSLKKYNSICKTNCFNLIKLTNNLIDNSKIISDYLVPRLKVSNIVEIIEDNVMSLIEYIKWNDIELIFDTNVEECYLSIDEEFMQRIILNLISNAIKYNKKGGKIEVNIVEKEKEVHISVKDNGIGMKEGFKNKAFDRYSIQMRKQKFTKKSSGLGLFVVKQLVELQNGEIFIESKLNEGTEVIIILKKDNEI